MGVVEFMSWDRFYNWIGGACGAVIGIIGGWTTAYTILIVLMMIDYITGVVCGIKDHMLSSHYGFVGICKKLMMAVMVLVGVILDSAIGEAHVLRDAVVMFYTVNEAISIIENADHLGVPFPAFITGMLKEIRENKNQGIDK